MHVAVDYVGKEKTKLRFDDKLRKQQVSIILELKNYGIRVVVFSFI